MSGDYRLILSDSMSPQLTSTFPLSISSPATSFSTVSALHQICTSSNLTSIISTNLTFVFYFISLITSKVLLFNHFFAFFRLKMRFAGTANSTIWRFFHLNPIISFGWDVDLNDKVPDYSWTILLKYLHQQRLLLVENQWWVLSTSLLFTYLIGNLLKSFCLSTLSLFIHVLRLHSFCSSEKIVFIKKLRVFPFSKRILYMAFK